MKKHFFSILSFAFLIGLFTISSVFSQQKSNASKNSGTELKEVKTAIVIGRVYKIGFKDPYDWSKEKNRSVYDRNSSARVRFSGNGYYRLKCKIVGGKVHLRASARPGGITSWSWKGEASLPAGIPIINIGCRRVPIFFSKMETE